MAKKDGYYIKGNPDSTFIGVFFSVLGKKITRVFFHLKGKDLVGGTGGLVVGEFKNYKKTIERLNTEVKLAENKLEDLTEDLVTLANDEAMVTATSGKIVLDNLRGILDDHGVDWEDDDWNDEESYGYEANEDEDEDE